MYKTVRKEFVVSDYWITKVFPFCIVAFILPPFKLMLPPNHAR